MEVAVRLRPVDKPANLYWEVDRGSIKSKCNNFQFDHVFNVDATTDDIYNKLCSPIINSYVEGINATIFAYGQTASGKSFTMWGNAESNTMGIIPSSIIEIFNLFQQQSDRQFLLSLTYMEIYNEKITDLFDPDNDKLKIRQEPSGSVAVSLLTEVACKTLDEMVRALKSGNDNRTIGETNFNLRSTRAHTIITISLQSRSIEEDSPAKVSSLHLVDLAGSERPPTATNEVQRFREGTYINCSLLALGNVISCLSEGRSYIPYRDSKLTRILQSSLGGNSRTLIICTISPNSLDETTSTLRFASRAKSVKNKPIINEVITIEQELKKQVNALTQQIQTLKKSNNTCMDEERKQFLSEICALEDAKVKAEQRVQTLERHLDSHVISTKSNITESDQQCSMKNRRKTYLVETVQQAKDKIMSSPLMLQNEYPRPRRQTMFKSRSKNITFVSLRSPIIDDLPVITSLDYNENSVFDNQPMTKDAWIQSCPFITESFTQTDCQPKSNQATQTEILSVAINCDQADSCIYSDLNQSYLCQHRSNAVSVNRELENALFINDEHNVELVLLQETNTIMEKEICKLKTELQQRSEELEKAKCETSTVSNTDLDKLQNENTRLNDALKSSKLEFNKLERVLKQKQDIIDSCNGIEQNMLRELNRMKEENIKLRAKIEETLNKFKGIEGELFAQLDKVDQLKQENTNLQATMEVLNREIKKHERELELKQETLNKFEGIEQELFAELDKTDLLKEENTKLQATIECIQNKVQGYKTTIEKYHKSREKSQELKQELLCELTKVDQLKQENTNLQATMELLNREIKKDERELELKQETLNKFEGIEQELFAELDKTDLLKEENASLKAAIEQLKVDVSVCNDTNAQLESTLQLIRSEMQTLQTMLTKTQRNDINITTESSDEIEHFKQENIRLMTSVGELKADLEMANDEITQLKEELQELKMTPVNKLDLMREIHALKKENEQTIMKLRFVSSDISSNLRVGRVETSEIAGYHKLIKELEAKNKRLISEMLKYRNERNELRKKYNCDNNETDAPLEQEESKRPFKNVVTVQELEKELEILEYERLSVLCENNKLARKIDLYKSEMYRYRKERNELRAELSAEDEESSVKENVKPIVKEKVTKIVKMKENVKEKDENVCEPVIQLSVEAPDLDQPLKDHYEWDWERSIAEAETESVVRIPFDVYEKTPKKPLSHPSNCNQQ